MQFNVRFALDVTPAQAAVILVDATGSELKMYRKVLDLTGVTAADQASIQTTANDLETAYNADQSALSAAALAATTATTVNTAAYSATIAAFAGTNSTTN